MEVPVNIKTKELVGYSREGENCFRCVTDIGQVIWITESGHSIHPSDILKWGDADWHGILQDKIRRNFYPNKPIKKQKAATMKAKRKVPSDYDKVLALIERVWKAGGEKEIDGVTWKITVE